jgi:hypothetical protein
MASAALQLARRRAEISRGGGEGNGTGRDGKKVKAAPSPVACYPAWTWSTSPPVTVRRSASWVYRLGARRFCVMGKGALDVDRGGLSLAKSGGPRN